MISLIANKFGLDTNLVIDLLRFEPATKPSTGKGEVFMMTFIDGAKKGSVGDVDINGVEYEVKGTNARIRGQRGFGAQTAGARAFLNGLKELIQKSGLKLDVGTQYMLMMEIGLIMYQSIRLLVVYINQHHKLLLMVM